MLLIAAALGALQAEAAPATPSELVAIVREERARLEAQQRALDAQRKRLEALEARLAQVSSPPPAPAPVEVAAVPTAQTSNTARPETVGEAPEAERAIGIAAVSPEGGILTRAGRLTLESELQYTRADDNRVLFRGVQIPASVLIGVFDITENHQDLLTAALGARIGLSSRAEFSVRVPFVYRSELTLVTPVAQSTAPAEGGAGDQGAIHARGIGDIEFGMRYQLTESDGMAPYVIAGMQAVAATGSDPFGVPFDDLGNARRSSTGAGFWGVTPTLTAILPSDPAVVYASVGYTYNFARTIDRRIGSAFVERVAPGGQPTASAGFALSINPDLSISIGYAHTMALGTRSRVRSIDATTGALSDPIETRTRDLQLGRLLFGLSYRTGPRTTLNWTLEAGQTQDSPDLRLALRVPFTIDAF